MFGYLLLVCLADCLLVNLSVILDCCWLYIFLGLWLQCSVKPCKWPSTLSDLPLIYFVPVLWRLLVSMTTDHFDPAIWLLNHGTDIYTPGWPASWSTMLYPFSVQAQGEACVYGVGHRVLLYFNRIRKMYKRDQSDSWITKAQTNEILHEGCTQEFSKGLGSKTA